MRRLLRLTTARTALGAALFAGLCAGLPLAAQAQDRIDASGRLQPGDPLLPTEEWYDSYTLDLRAGQSVDIRATSSEFDTYLLVRGPNNTRWENDDESPDSRQARINEVAPVSGQYTVVVTSYRAAEMGAYRLTATPGNARADARQNEPAPRPQVRPANTGRGNGPNQRGDLVAGDAQLNSGEYYDAFQVDGRAGQQLRINVSSDQFDTYLMLRGPDGSSFDNDDAPGGGTNSELLVTLPASGTYRLMVTSYRPGETGAYALTSNGQPILAANGGNGRSGGRDGGRENGGTSTVGGAASSGQRLAVGSPVNGQLAQGDSRLDSGEFFDVYTLTADPGSQLVVDMQSTAIDTYLGAFGSGGYEVSNDDDTSGRGGTNSRLEVTMPESGVLTVAATSYAGGETGPYRLSASFAGTSSRAQGTGERLAPGRPVAGALESSDMRDQRSRTDVYLLEGQAGQQVRLSLSSDAFDPLIRIEGPGGFVAENDDDPAGGTLNSVLDATLPQAGSYRVVVGSYGADGLGAYNLALGGGSGRASTGGPAIASSNGSGISLGQTLQGSLDRGDQTISSGEYSDFYAFEGRRGERLVFDMASSEFDTYLSLHFPGGGQEDNDDRAGGNDTNSRLVVTLPEDGAYRLMATSYQPGESGGYQISMAPPSVADGTLDPRIGSSRVFVLSVGVSEYERMNTLDLTDQDAIKLTQTLERTGMLGDQSVTLVNAQATRANFEAAVADISRNIGPDDLFLVFFSGHGDKVQVDRGIEADGISETIELFDVALSDYELNAMIEPIHARTLLVLDSCFSGGFDDVINGRIGRMGIFSSDSDVTSLVASKFEAGGYISHILQLAMEGQADANADSAITAGELSEFMRTTFYQIALSDPLESDWYDTARGHSGSGYQHIVVNRGGDGMPYEEVLVNLTSGG